MQAEPENLGTPQRVDIRTVSPLSEGRGTLIVGGLCDGIWTSQQLDPIRDVDTIQNVSSLAVQLVRLLEERASFQKLYRASMDSKGRLREALSVAGTDFLSLDLGEELARTGALQTRLESYEVDLCRRTHDLIVELAHLGVYSIRGMYMGISPTTEVQDPYRLEKLLAAIPLREAQMRWRTGADGLSAVETAEQTGYSIDQIAPVGGRFDL